MKPHRVLFLLVCAACSSAVALPAETPPAISPASAVTPAPDPKAAPPPPLSPRMKLVRDRIDSLFQHRNATPAAATAVMDPFRPAGAVPEPPMVFARDGEPARSVVPQTTTDLAQLQGAVATLKMTGVIEIGGRLHLVVNSRPYKEGDVIQTLAEGTRAYLRIRQVSRNSITLAINDAEMTLKF